MLWLRMRAAWRRGWLSLLAVSLLIAVTAGATITAVAGARRSQSAPARFLLEDGTGDVMVFIPNGGSLEGVKEISALPQVSDVAVSAALAAFPYSESGAYMPVFAPIDGKAGTKTMRGVLVAGRRPDPRATDEIMLSEGHARILGARVGDRVPLVAFTQRQAERCLYDEGQSTECEKLFRTPSLTVRVVGIARTAEDVNTRVDDLDTENTDITISVLSGKFLEHHRQRVGWTPILSVRLRPDASAESFVAAARPLLPAGVEGEFNAQNAGPVFDAVGVLSTSLALFALVVGLAGGFAVGQAVVRQVRADDEERAVLATLGATGRALIADALAPVGLATILGVGGAVIGAYLASAWMPIGVARRVDPSRGPELDWAVVLGCIAVFVVLVAGAAVAAVRLSRRRVVAPVRPSSVSALVGRVPTSAASSVGLRHACSPGRGRSSVPVRSALVGVAAAAAGIVGVLGFSAGLSHLVQTPRLYGWSFDVLGVNTDYTSRVVSDPAVAAVADVRMGLLVRVQGRPTLGTSFTSIVGDIGPAVIAGRAPIAKDEIALGADTLHAAGAHLGDTVAVAGADGSLAMRVVGQAVFSTRDDGYPLADGAVVAPAAVDVLGRSGSHHTLAVRFRPDVDHAAAYQRLDALDADVVADGGSPNRPAPPVEVERLRQVESLPKVLAAFLALLGAVALAHALVVSVRRRARDFAVLRALGFRRRDVRAAVSWEAGALTFAGVSIGIPLGIVIARLAWARTARGVGVLVVHQLPVGIALVLVPAAVILAVVIALVPAHRAARMRSAEILRSE